MWDDALAICDIFGKDPKKIGLTKHIKFYKLETESEIPTVMIEGKMYYEDFILRYYLQASFETKRWIMLKNRHTEIIPNEDYIVRKGRYYFSQQGALKMCADRKYAGIKALIEKNN